MNTAVIGHYNSIRKADGGRDSTLETFFSKEVEHAVGPILRRIATDGARNLTWEKHFNPDYLRRERRALINDGFRPPEKCWTLRLDGTERRALARYVASMLVRVPSYKDELNSRRMLEMVGNLLGISGPSALQATDEMHVEILLNHLEEYARRLYDYAWVLVASPKEELLFGDTPVIPAALGWSEADAIFPVTPNRALLITRGYTPPVSDALMILEALPKSVRAMNVTMMQNAEQQIFCRTPIVPSVVVKHLGKRQVRLEPNIETAAGNHSSKGPMLG